MLPLRADILDNDLTLIYMGARIGLEHGWSQIYSIAPQHDLFTRLRPHAVFNDGERFISPPPYAWLVLPLTLLGPAGAVLAWLALSAAALVAAWWLAAPGRMPMKGLWLLGALAWYPLLYGFSLAQPDLVIVLVVALAWRLAESEKPYLAGLVLALSVVKPQLTLLLPVALLFSGRWKIAAAWAVAVAAITLGSLAAIGSQGLNDYLKLLSDAQHVANNRYFTLAYLFGSGPAAYVAQGVVVAATVVAAYLNRRASNARIFALGLVATVLGATYLHLQDLTILVPAAWLFWREAPAAWSRAWLLVVAVASEFAWGLTPLPVLVALAAWFLLVSLQPRPARAAA